MSPHGLISRLMMIPLLMSRNIIGYVISAICVLVLLSKTDLKSLLFSISQFDVALSALCIIAIALGSFLKIYRWHKILEGPYQPTPSSLVAPYLASIAANNLMPMRAGDLLRSFIFSSNIGVPRHYSFGSVMVERLCDLIILLLIFCGCLLMHNEKSLWLSSGVQATSLIFFTFLILVFISFLAKAPLLKLFQKLITALSVKHIVIKKFQKPVLEFLNALKRMLHKKLLVRVFAMTLAAWVCESVIFYIVLIGLGWHLPYWAALLAMASATLATMVPSSPGYIGPFHFAAYTAAISQGLDNSSALAFAAVSHAMIWAPTTIAGVAATIFKPNMFIFLINKKEKETRENCQNFKS